MNQNMPSLFQVVLFGSCGISDSKQAQPSLQRGPMVPKQSWLSSLVDEFSILAFMQSQG